MSFIEMSEKFSGKYTAKLNNFQDPLEQAFGVNYFFYAFISTDRRLSCIGSNGDLVQHFFDEKMHFAWPFLMKTDEVKSGMYLYDSVQNPDFQTNMERLEQKFQTKHSCMVTEQDNTGCHIYGFAVPPSRRGYETLFLNERSLLDKFTGYFQTEMQTTIAEIKEQSIDLSSFDQMTLTSKDSFTLPEIHLDYTKRINLLRKMNLNFGDIRFTNRELDVIQSLLQGKSAREIAESIFLSRRTVEHHMECLKSKLHCSSKSELFERLTDLKRFNLIS